MPTAAETPTREVSGRALLREVDAARGARWQEARTVSFRLHDEWKGMAALMSPWGSAVVDGDVALRVGSFDSRIAFAGGDHAGQVWGLQSFQSWSTTAGSTPIFKDNSNARFILSALHYFAELEGRAAGAPVVVELSPEAVNGVDYRRVFFAWSVEPSETSDQFIAYVHPTEKRIEHVKYTVRDMAPFLTGTMHFGGFVVVDGGRFATQQTVTAEPADNIDDFMHRVTVVPESIRFDAVTAESFVVDAKLPVLGDTKP